MKPNVEKTIQAICEHYNAGSERIVYGIVPMHDLALSHVALQKELLQIKTMILESSAKGRETIQRIDKVLP